MLCAAKFGKGGLLSKQYEVSLGKNAAEDAVCRHYVGAGRDRFYAEGIKRLPRPIASPGSVTLSEPFFQNRRSR